MRAYYRILCVGLVFSVVTVPSLLAQSSGSGQSSAYDVHSTGVDGYVSNGSSSSSSVESRVTLRAVPSSLNFGVVHVGGTATDTIQLVLDESSDSPLHGNVPSKSGDFSIISGDGEFLLQPGETRTLIVEFRPSLALDLRDFIGVFHDGSSVAGGTAMLIPVFGLGQVVSSVSKDDNALSETMHVQPNLLQAGETSQLKFSLAKQARVEISLVAVNGSTTTLVAEQSMEAGEHSVEIELPKRIASGHYYVRLHSDNGSLYKPLLITE